MKTPLMFTPLSLVGMLAAAPARAQQTIGQRRERPGRNSRVNDVLVVKTDIAASNDVIHVIDTVLLPPGE